jgi:hypothetical protein
MTRGAQNLLPAACLVLPQRPKDVRDNAATTWTNDETENENKNKN